MIAGLTFDSSISLGTMLHLGILLVAISVAWGTLMQQLKDIKERLGCTEEDVEKQGEKTASVLSRLAALETDMAWVKRKETNVPIKR